jgi:hypothetical protein
MEPEAPPHRHRSRGVVRGEYSSLVFAIDKLTDTNITEILLKVALKTHHNMGHSSGKPHTAIFNKITIYIWQTPHSIIQQNNHQQHEPLLHY